jgi:hypothetical protein
VLIASVKGGRKGSSLVLLKRQGRRNRWDHVAHVVQQHNHHHHHHHQQQQQQKNKLSKTSLRLPKENTTGIV